MRKILDNLANELAGYPENSDAVDIKNAILEQRPNTIEDGFSLVQRAERVLKMIAAGAYTNTELLTHLNHTQDPLWKDDTEITITDEQAQAMAMQFYISNQRAPGEKTIMKISHIGKKVGEAIIAIFENAGKPLSDIDLEEPYFHATLIEGVGEKGYNAIANRRAQKRKNAEKMINIRQDLPSDIQTKFSKETNDHIESFLKVGTQAFRSGELFYTLTLLPTKEDAMADNMPYDKYTELFFESVDQPWEEMGKAHEFLINILDNANILHIRNKDGTDIKMDITGMTFANSLVLKNIPGSEIFSAPIRTSVNGTIAAKGTFKYDNSPLIKDITFRVKDGEIYECDAIENGQALKDIVFKIPGANYFGEIGIGTNRHLQRQFLNGLLVEKVGGSFHMAVGGSYRYTVYDGKPINLDNGNTSAIHRDITTMLRGQDSEIIVDGTTIQQNGKWLAPELTVLNEGRGAIPQEKQPERRKRKYPQGYTE